MTITMQLSHPSSSNRSATISKTLNYPKKLAVSDARCFVGNTRSPPGTGPTSAMVRPKQEHSRSQ